MCGACDTLASLETSCSCFGGGAAEVCLARAAAAAAALFSRFPPRGRLGLYSYDYLLGVHRPAGVRLLVWGCLQVVGSERTRGAAAAARLGIAAVDRSSLLAAARGREARDNMAARRVLGAIRSGPRMLALLPR